MSKDIFIEFCPAETGVRPDNKHLQYAWQYLKKPKYLRCLTFVGFSGRTANLLRIKPAFPYLKKLELVSLSMLPAFGRYFENILVNKIKLK